MKTHVSGISVHFTAQKCGPSTIFKQNVQVNSIPGEKMSGLKRISNDVSLTEPTALHALRITSRLFKSTRNKKKKKNYTHTYIYLNGFQAHKYQLYEDNAPTVVQARSIQKDV